MATGDNPKPMTKGERQELGSLIRKREKVMKAEAEKRSAALLADYDAQSAKIYHWDNDEIWKQAHDEAEKAVEAARRSIAERCQQIGIPAEFAPDLQLYWSGRGHNALAQRRQELRQAAKSRIAAMERDALAQIERLSLQAQTEIVASGLQSEAAQNFLKTMPTMDALMPPVAIDEIEALVATRRAERRQNLLN